jgi:hypothetical protein
MGTIIEQTVEIGENGWFHLDLHTEYPSGTSAKVVVTAPLAPEKAETAPRPMSHRAAIEKCRGIAKGSGFTSERLFEERRRDAELDETQYRKIFHKEGDND